MPQPEAFSRILIDKALEFSGWEPLPLQKESAARVSDIRAMQAEQSASRHRLDDLFHSMLHRAFQGEL